MGTPDSGPSVERTMRKLTVSMAVAAVLTACASSTTASPARTTLTTLPATTTAAATSASTRASIDSTAPPERCVIAAPDNGSGVRLLFRTDAACVAMDGLELAVINPTATLCRSDVLADLSDGTQLRFASASGYGGATERWEPLPANEENVGIMEYPPGERHWPVSLPNLQPGRYTITIHATCADSLVDLATSFEVKNR